MTKIEIAEELGVMIDQLYDMEGKLSSLLKDAGMHGIGLNDCVYNAFLPLRKYIEDEKKSIEAVASMRDYFMVTVGDEVHQKLDEAFLDGVTDACYQCPGTCFSTLRIEDLTERMYQCNKVMKNRLNKKHGNIYL